MSETAEKMQNISQPLIAQRQALISRLLRASREIRGLPATMNAEDLASMASSWNRALRDVPTRELVECYDRAIAEYVDVDKPFGTPQMLKAYQSILDDQRHARVQSIKPSSDGSCLYCSGSGYQTILMTKPEERILNGEKYTAPPGHTTARPCACSAAPAGQRSDFPLREPMYSREPGGRWWFRNE